MSVLATILISTFWIGLVAGAAIAVIWRFVAPGPLRMRVFLQSAAAILVLLPQLVILFLMNQSIKLFLYQQALLTLWLLSVGLISAWGFIKRLTGKTGESGVPSRLSRWRKTDQELAFEQGIRQSFAVRRQRSNPAVLLLLACTMTGGAIYFGSQFFADSFCPRLEVHGQVQRLMFRGRRAARVLIVVIGGKSFTATRDLAGVLHVGDRIRAEIGAGSNTILGWHAEY
jgi:hypothetical protein